MASRNSNVASLLYLCYKYHPHARRYHTVYLPLRQLFSSSLTVGRKGNVLFFRDVGIQLNKERPINLSLELTPYNSAFIYIYIYIFSRSNEECFIIFSFFKINRITNGLTTVNCYSRLLIKVSPVFSVLQLRNCQGSRPSAAERSRTLTNRINR